jgi:hypothetical protein
MNKIVLVPQSDIDAVEEARKKLFDIIPEQYHCRLTFEITDKLYHLTHRKYAVSRLYRALQFVKNILQWFYTNIIKDDCGCCHNH